MTALFVAQRKKLGVEGILPEPIVGAVPNLGRLGVFLAKEILRLITVKFTLAQLEGQKFLSHFVPCDQFERRIAMWC